MPTLHNSKRRRTKAPKRAFVVTSAVSMIATGACGSSSSATNTTGSPDAGDAGAGCPTTAPALNSACTDDPSAPSPLECTYGAVCATTSFMCRDGVWGYGPFGNPPAPTCPATLPANGSDCPCNFPETLVCDFGACVMGSDAGASSSGEARCLSHTHTWLVAPCTAGGVDGGADH